MRRTVSPEDIDRLAGDGTLVVTRDMVLTPAAREYATKKGLTVTYGDPPRKAPEPVAEDALARLIEEVVMQELGNKPTQPLAVAEVAPPPSIPGSAAMDPAVQDGLGADCLQAVLDHPERQTPGPRAIVTVVGGNRAGIVAQISAAVAECGGDLEDISQTVIDKYFSMIFVVNLAGLETNSISFRVFKERLQDVAARLGQVQVLVMHEDIFKAMHEV
jgi:ACT domain-containing protein